jgi:hypothetical protein
MNIDITPGRKNMIMQPPIILRNHLLNRRLRIKLEKRYQVDLKGASMKIL